MSFFDLMGTGTATATEEALELIESSEESDEPEDIDIRDIEELDPYRSDDACETETEKVEEVLVENGVGIDGVIHDIPKFVDTLDRYLFGEEQSESPAPPTLTQIDETKCVDEDGVVHAIPKAETPEPKAESAEPKIPDVLIKLFGNTLLVR